MKRLMAICAVVTILLAVSSVAQATLLLSWQTAPILGTDQNDITGDVVVITGSTPINPSTGLPYRDVDNNIVLGPTIPHYSIVGDPLYHVGSPSMTVFDITGKVANGSGINLDAGHTYDWTAVYTNLGTLYADSSADVYSGGDFIMLHGYLWGIGGTSTLGLEDVGAWKYVETWTDQAGGEGSSISSTTFFTIVPEPATVALLGLGALSLLRRKRGA